MRYLQVLATAGAVIATSVSLAQEMPKEMWSAQMRTGLTHAFCSSEQYFRKCFNVQETQCRTVVAEATDACLKQFDSKIPARLKLPADGQHWGSQVGMCAGNAYEVALIKQRINTAKCNDPKNWQ
jgi:hypothetical protein